MEPGKILIAENDGNYLVKLVGYVRLTLCTSLNRYIDGIFKSSNGNIAADGANHVLANNVLIDLCDTEGLDSTTLGLLAKLALHCQREFKLKPLLFCANPGIVRELEVMAIDAYFDIVASPCDAGASSDMLQELPEAEAAPELVRDQVLDAHRLLVELNPACEKDFADLISTLEQEASCA